MASCNDMYGGRNNEQYGEPGAGNSIIVEPGDDLQVKYDWLKSSDRDGAMGALSDDNWRYLILSAGTYDLSAAITWDADYVGVIGPGGKSAVITRSSHGTGNAGNIINITAAKIKCCGWAVHDQATDTDAYYNGISLQQGATAFVDDQSATVTKPAAVSVLNVTGIAAAAGITAANVADFMVYVNGTGIDHTTYSPWNAIDSYTAGTITLAVDVGTCPGDDLHYCVMPINSEFHDIHGISDGANPNLHDCIWGENGISGKWYNCSTNQYGWRLSIYALMRVKMYSCWSDPDNDGFVAGDGTNASALAKITESYFYDCHGGSTAFGGCTQWAVAIDEFCEFHNCSAGIRSFAMANTCAGKFSNCTVTGSGFGANGGDFTGYARNCYVGEDVEVTLLSAFGMGHATEGACSGTLDNCHIGNLYASGDLTGATLRGCYVSIASGQGTNLDTLTITDSNSKIYNCTVITKGTGEPIYAAAGLNVVVCHSRTNGTAFDNHANVTNLIGAPQNVEDSDIA